MCVCVSFRLALDRFEMSQLRNSFSFKKKCLPLLLRAKNIFYTYVRLSISQKWSLLKWKQLSLKINKSSYMNLSVSN